MQWITSACDRLAKPGGGGPLYTIAFCAIAILFTASPAEGAPWSCAELGEQLSKQINDPTSALKDLHIRFEEAGSRIVLEGAKNVNAYLNCGSDGSVAEITATVPTDRGTAEDVASNLIRLRYLTGLFFTTVAGASDAQGAGLARQLFDGAIADLRKNAARTKPIDNGYSEAIVPGTNAEAFVRINEGLCLVNIGSGSRFLAKPQAQGASREVVAKLADASSSALTLAIIDAGGPISENIFEVRRLRFLLTALSHASNEPPSRIADMIAKAREIAARRGRSVSTRDLAERAFEEKMALRRSDLAGLLARILPAP